MTCFLVHHHPRQGGVGAVAALGTAAGRGKSGPRSSALQRTSEVRLGTPCRGAAQSQNRGDFAEQRSQGEAALVGHFVFLFFFWDDFGMDLELVVIFFLNLKKVLQTGPPAPNFQVPPAPPTTTIPTIPVAAASPRRDQSPSPKKPKSGSGSGMIRGFLWVSTLKDAQTMKISKRIPPINPISIGSQEIWSNFDF